MQVSMREFNSHLASYINQAQAEQLIELTSHRKVVALLVGAPQADSVGVSSLLAKGIASWSRLVLPLSYKTMVRRFLNGYWKVAVDFVVRYFGAC